MTMTAEPPVMPWNTGRLPNCPGDRHQPRHESYIRGCRCPGTITAEDEWQIARAQRLAARKVRRAELRDDCPSINRHGASETAWKLGCRCPGAVAAHSEQIIAWRRARDTALARWRETGECTAAGHLSRIAYERHGCRCPIAVRKQEERAKRRRKPKDPLAGVVLRHRVGRTDLLMVLTGALPPEGIGVVIAAEARLSRLRVPHGPARWRRISDLELAERLRIPSRVIYRARAERERLRQVRTYRRLQESKRRAMGR